jgi:hypothetical protein
VLEGQRLLAPDGGTPVPGQGARQVTYSPPERFAERALARRQLAKVYRKGGCHYCLHAVHGWGKSACNTMGRTFPLCLKTPGTQFEPDHERLKGVSQCTSES